MCLKSSPLPISSPNESSSDSLLLPIITRLRLPHSTQAHQKKEITGKEESLP